ncbi:MAG: sugar phosphate isomerase/epimerase [Firmicutes bacterium]|nr:sugar phosphate isomerase/epimerase [Bacillota bacterium]
MIQGIGINADSGRIDGRLDVLEADLRKFAEAGFEWVEIAAHSLDVLVHGSLIPSRLHEVKRLVSSFDLKYTLHCPDPTNLMDRVFGELHKQVLHACLELAAEIEAPIVVYHCGQPDSPEEEAELCKREREALAELGQRAQTLGVTICVENALLSPFTFPERTGFSAARIDHVVGHIEEIAHPSVKLCLDIGHGFIAANVLGFDLAEGLRRAQPYIRHLHLHDNFGLYNPNSGGKIINSLPFGFGDLHRAPGDGSIPYAALTDDIRACEAVALVELNPRYQTPERLRRMLGDLKERFM